VMVDTDPTPTIDSETGNEIYHEKAVHDFK
jgi:hypothetical protein